MGAFSLIVVINLLNRSMEKTTVVDSTALNSPSVGNRCKNAPIKAFNFQRSNDTFFCDSASSRNRKRESPLFTIGNTSPQNLENDLYQLLTSPVELAHSIRRTCSVDALHNYKRFQKEKYLKYCKCFEEIRQHRRLSSTCSYGDENAAPKEKTKMKKLGRVPSKTFGSSCGRCQLSPNGKSNRPASATLNSSGYGGRHSAIGFTIGSPLQNIHNAAAAATVTFSSGSSPISITRQRSSVDSAIELECIPTFSYDNSCSLLDGRKCPVDFDRSSMEEKSVVSGNGSNPMSTLWPPSPRCFGSTGSRKACSPNAFAREPPAGVERVQVIHEDRALSDFSNTPMFFAPDKKVGMILKPSFNSAFCPLLPTRGGVNSNSSKSSSKSSLNQSGDQQDLSLCANSSNE